MPKKVIIVGSGNAALSAGIGALEKGAEKARKVANKVLDRVRTKLGY